MTKSRHRTALDAKRELAFIRAQRERAAALITERQRRTDALRARLRLLEAEWHRAFGSLVTMRFFAIRQRHRASYARLMAPRASGADGKTDEYDFGRDGIGQNGDSSRPKEPAS